MLLKARVFCYNHVQGESCRLERQKDRNENVFKMVSFSLTKNTGVFILMPVDFERCGGRMLC